MEYIKKFFKSYLYTIIPILIITLILTIFNYFSIMNYTTLKILEYILLFISIFIGSFILGKSSKKKGILEGVKFGLIIVIFILLLNLIAFNTSFNIKTFIYYSMIMITSIIGSVLGINKKK